ncbi:ribonuclease HI [Aestuariivirga litoralis]|uniref:ribonuclease HI n=1 Tax=Aestuariivirga litoralis TaxID=2650924 RepID=UPI0018C4BCDE|nr:ribonuclease HI [Aestuariivirga litoralis]MBG1230893.1 ribonuclease HI [Aestuariivirga litoralis]
MASLEHVIVYADGSCLNNPGPGGYAVIMRRGADERVLVGGASHTTNNQMELAGPIAALKSMKTDAPITFVLDAKYVVDGMTRWVFGWRKNGWRTADKKPVKNLALWQELLALTEGRVVQWLWVKGHGDDVVNQEVDRLARQEAERQSARLSSHP